MPDGVGLQPIRNFVVQIRHNATDEIVGTGFVAKEGIITCVHVVRDAGVDTLSVGGEVGVYFPERQGRPSVYRKSRVVRFFPEHDDDVVLLKLIDGPSPLPPELVARLGSAQDSKLHDFQSFGYRRLNDYHGLPAYGKILDFGEKPLAKKMHGEPLMLCSQHIDRGMSGAPVLDVQRNLITGVIYLSWDCAEANCDRDTGFAVDARVLSLAPLGLSMQDEDLPKALAPVPKVDIPAARAKAESEQTAQWNNAPTSLKEWVGRKKLLDEITSDWINPGIKITGLVGFGGEGKSGLARRWVDNMLTSPSLPKPDGLFWWGFYERRNIDKFFEAVLNYLSGGKIDAIKLPSANLRAQIIGAMLGAGRYLFVLDGLEVMQYQEGDMYGSLKSPDLKAFLEFFVAPDHNSFCLITSRAPLQDLTEYTTYNQRNVDRLTPEDGRDLLFQLGVRGKTKELDGVVRDWDGHALTLSLLASYLKEHHNGDIIHIRDIPPPTGDEPRYERVHKVLMQYDKHFTFAERSFLEILSVFRTPVMEKDFVRIFRASLASRDGRLGPKDQPVNPHLAELDDAQLDDVANRLSEYRILRKEPITGQYTAHPLIKAHYYTLLTIEQKQTKEAHQKVKEYYLNRSEDLPDNPSMGELMPLIEVVHHTCKCGAYDEAEKLRWERIDHGEEHYIGKKLGAWETQLEIMQEFFPDNDMNQEPKLSNSLDKAWILNEVGLCLKNLGSAGRAEGFYQRSLKIYRDWREWANACLTYMNLADLYALQGELYKSEKAAEEALKLASRATEKKDYEQNSLVYQGWALHLQGKMEEAGRAFLRAKALEGPYLYGLQGIQHADHLRCAEDVDYSREVTEANLKHCEEQQWPNHISRCHRLLGDLCADLAQQDVAMHYLLALDIARNISHKPVLIEALLAKGRWEARHLRDPKAASDDLTEALDYAKAGGYRLYEADIRVALAWAHLAEGNEKFAKEEVAYALQMSEGMGYHWGKVDANEVLAEIASKQGLPKTRDTRLPRAPRSSQPGHDGES